MVITRITPFLNFFLLHIFFLRTKHLVYLTHSKVGCVGNYIQLRVQIFDILTAILNVQYSIMKYVGVLKIIFSLQSYIETLYDPHSINSRDTFLFLFHQKPVGNILSLEVPLSALRS